LAHDVALPAGEIGENTLEPLSFGVSLFRGVDVDACEVGGEQVLPVRAEHAIGVESRDCFEDDVFADVGGLPLAIGAALGSRNCWSQRLGPTLH
jgi:hypothetical protein